MSTTGIDMRARLSWMWVFVMLNMLLADILSFMYPGFLRQILDGHAEGIVITPEFLLLAAVLTEIPIAMVLLTQVLPQRAARWANLVAGVVTIVYIVGMGAAVPHYYFIAGLETLACILIVWSAWTWRTGDNKLAAPARPVAPEQAPLQQI